MTRRMANAVIWTFAAALVACGTPPPPRPLSAADMLPVQAKLDPPRGSSPFPIRLHDSEADQLAALHPQIPKCIAIWNLPSRQDLPQLLNYAGAVGLKDRTALARLQEARMALLELDAAARQDLEATRVFDEVVRSRDAMTKALREVLTKAGRAPLLWVTTVPEICQLMLERPFGQQALKLERALRAFRESVLPAARAGDGRARTAFLVTDAKSLAEINEQLARARGGGGGDATAALLGIFVIGALAASMSGQGAEPPRRKNCVRLQEPASSTDWADEVDGYGRRWIYREHCD